MITLSQALYLRAGIIEVEQGPCPHKMSVPMKRQEVNKQASE